MGELLGWGGDDQNMLCACTSLPEWNPLFCIIDMHYKNHHFHAVDTKQASRRAFLHPALYIQSRTKWDSTSGLPAPKNVLFSQDAKQGWLMSHLFWILKTHRTEKQSLGEQTNTRCGSKSKCKCGGNAIHEGLSQMDIWQNCKISVFSGLSAWPCPDPPPFNDYNIFFNSLSHQKQALISHWYIIFIRHLVQFYCNHSEF